MEKPRFFVENVKTDMDMDMNMNTKIIKKAFACVGLSIICGIFTGTIIFIFKLIASYIISASGQVYEFVRVNPRYIPVLFVCLGAVAAGIYYVLKAEPECKGSGIPTAVLYIKEFIQFRWLKTMLLLPVSAWLTFFSGIPLGNEGPSVQLGCCTGKGIANIFGKKDKLWSGWLMTGGASAGFASATGAPVAAIMFALEEIHTRANSFGLISALVSVLSATGITKVLGKIFQVKTSLMDIAVKTVMPVEYIWMAAIVGVVSGIGAIILAGLYKVTGQLEKKWLHKIPAFVKIMAVVLAAGAMGLISDTFIGSGHSLIGALLNKESLSMALLLAALFVRGIMLALSNNAGITGGTFLPTLAIGAVIGELCGRVFFATGAMPEEYKIIIITMGIAAFLGAKVKAPLLAVCFSLEVLSAYQNIFMFLVCVVCSALVALLYDIVIKRFCGKVNKDNALKDCDYEDKNNIGESSLCKKEEI